MRFLALDVGKKRIGVAVSDPLGVTARPHSTLERNRTAQERVMALVSELGVDKIIVGLPLHLSGEEGEQAKDVRKFVDRLTRLVGEIPVEFYDERLTTVEAEERYRDRRRDWRKRKSTIDALAAAVILEEYLKNQ